MNRKRKKCISFSYSNFDWISFCFIANDTDALHFTFSYSYMNRCATNRLAQSTEWFLFHYLIIKLVCTCFLIQFRFFLTSSTSSSSFFPCNEEKMLVGIPRANVMDKTFRSSQIQNFMKWAGLYGGIVMHERLHVLWTVSVSLTVNIRLFDDMCHNLSYTRPIISYFGLDSMRIYEVRVCVNNSIWMDWHVKYTYTELRPLLGCHISKCEFWFWLDWIVLFSPSPLVFWFHRNACTQTIPKFRNENEWTKKKRINKKAHKHFDVSFGFSMKKFRNGIRLCLCLRTRSWFVPIIPHEHFSVTFDSKFLYICRCFVTYQIFQKIPSGSK